MRERPASGFDGQTSVIEGNSEGGCVDGRRRVKYYTGGLGAVDGWRALSPPVGFVPIRHYLPQWLLRSWMM